MSDLAKTVLVCGSRYWTNDERIEIPLRRAWDWGYRTLVHGGCKGADTIAGALGREIGFNVISEPAKWSELGRAAGALRNAAMLHMYTPSLVIAFPLPNSKGTRDMIAQARACGIEVEEYSG